MKGNYRRLGKRNGTKEKAGDGGGEAQEEASGDGDSWPSALWVVGRCSGRLARGP